MADFLKIASLLILLLFCKKSLSSEIESKEELVESESKDGKLEIIKQIKKLNDDGSYTIGYEADDGSFKIESRDVLGNIKGTYGYIDDSGQVKRVTYSTSNSSEVLTKSETPSSVVQRIPKTNRTHIYTTKRPTSLYSTTQPTSTSTNAIQRLHKLRLSTTTTTEKPNYSEVVNVDGAVKPTSKPAHLIYQSSTPRVLVQKSEGQLIRPEVVTEIPLFRRLALKHQILKPDEPEVRSNILRRQLSQEKTSNFDPQQHIFTLQQALGSDSTDVYSSSVTTGTPRPLFTTTVRPRALLSSTTAPTIISRPTIRYPVNYQQLETNPQESTTTEATISQTTPTSVPIVQIPPNRATPEPLVAINHPFQRGAILVPLSHLQGRVIPIEGAMQFVQNDGTTPKPIPEMEPRPIYVRRLPPPQFRPIPVQVDENGYIRDLPQNVQTTTYPLPIPITPAPPKYNDIENEIENISPPVSTRDFQKLLQQLIIRQTRLERISALTDPRRHPEFYQTRYNRPIYRPMPIQYYHDRGPVQFLPAQEQGQRQYVQQIGMRSQDDPYNVAITSQSYVPTRRVARLLQPGQDHRQETNNEEYLPPDVREMLLLRMLQLAINPALPLGEEEAMEETTPVPQYKKVPVRNVEILGEEAEEEKRPARSKPRMYYERQ